MFLGYVEVLLGIGWNGLMEIREWFCAAEVRKLNFPNRKWQRLDYKKRVF